jgi:hypothetical protein
MTWWHVFLLPYGLAIIMGTLAYFRKRYQWGKKLGIALYWVIVWFKTRKSRRILNGK